MIPTWRRAQWLQACLTSVAAQRPAPGEVIVVGRAEDEEARDLVHRFDRVTTRWAEVNAPGHVAPVVKGLLESTGQIVAFLDDDTRAEPSWLRELLAPFEDPRVACVGGRVITPGFIGKVHHDAGKIRWYGRYVGNIGAVEAAEVLDVEGVMEGNSAWRSGVLRALEFDPVLDNDDAAMYGFDLTQQARSLGYRVCYTSRARVLHADAPRDPSLRKSDRPSRIFSFTRNYTYIALRRFGTVRRGLYLAWSWLLGEREAYGLVKALADLPKVRLRVFKEWRSATEGRIEGARLYLRRGRG